MTLSKVYPFFWNSLYICEISTFRPEQEDGCDENGKMTLVDVGLMIIFGLCLPTWDVYSDLGLAINLVQPKCYGLPSALAYGIRHNHLSKGKFS